MIRRSEVEDDAVASEAIAKQANAHTPRTPRTPGTPKALSLDGYVAAHACSMHLLHMPTLHMRKRAPIHQGPTSTLGTPKALSLDGYVVAQAHNMHHAHSMHLLGFRVCMCGHAISCNANVRPDGGLGKGGGSRCLEPAASGAGNLREATWEGQGEGKARVQQEAQA